MPCWWRRAEPSDQKPHDGSVPSPSICAMAKDDTTPTLKEALKQERAQYDDCTPCRVIGEHRPRGKSGKRLELTIGTGSAAFIGLGTYTYVSGHSQLKAQEAVIQKSKSMFGLASRRAGVTGTAAVLVGLGIYRWFA